MGGSEHVPKVSLIPPTQKLTLCNLCCRWSQDLYELLRPAFPGQLPRLGRNLLNAVFLINPGTLTGCRWGLCNTLQGLSTRIIPTCRRCRLQLQGFHAGMS